MLIITWNEIETTTIGNLSNREYNRIYNNIAKTYGHNLAERLMVKLLNKTIRDCLDSSACNLLDGFQVI